MEAEAEPAYVPDPEIAATSVLHPTFDIPSRSRSPNPDPDSSTSRQGKGKAKAKQRQAKAKLGSKGTDM